MTGLSTVRVVTSGKCLVSPASVGLITEVSIALLLMQQPDAQGRSECTCHAADLRSTHHQSRILITDCEGEQHVFPILTSTLSEMLRLGWLQPSGDDGISCTRLQGTILKITSKGNFRAEFLRKIPRR